MLFPLFGSIFMAIGMLVVLSSHLPCPRLIGKAFVVVGMMMVIVGGFNQ